MGTHTHLDDLTQCARESDRPIGILLGAGCGTALKDDDGEPLVPDTRGLTDRIEYALSGSEHEEAWRSILSQIDSDEEDSLPPNIEDVLSQVRGLLSYAGDGTVRGLDASQLQDLERIICDSISNIVTQELPDQQTPYHNLANWLSSVDREEPVELFTTNYDLFIEQALEDMRVPYFDGFVGSHRPYFDAYAVSQDNLPARWTRLWKIHGSVNWVTAKKDGQRRVWRSDSDSEKKAVIHPSHMKYDESRKMPYLAMMDRLQRFISTPDSVLLVIGYSFGDDHLNDVLVQSLQGTPTSALFALMYDSLDNYAAAQQLAKRRSNFTLLARDGGIVGTKQVNWQAQREPPEDDPGTVGVEWSHTSDDEWQERMTVGDFNVFGEFLRQVMGTTASRSIEQ